jgi:hypothetical protein
MPPSAGIFPHLLSGGSLRRANQRWPPVGGAPPFGGERDDFPNPWRGQLASWGKEHEMNRNLGTADRVLRVLAAIAAAVCAVAGPFSPVVRLGIFGGTAGYLLLTALVGTCVGYRLMGKSTCPAIPRT